MAKLPTWIKALLGLLIFAALFGAARFLIWLDQLSSAKGGLD